MNMFKKAFTGIHDINRQPIFEGDTVCLYPCTKKRVKVGETDDGVEIYETVGEPRPDRLVDIVIYRGVIKYSPTAFVLKCDDNPSGVSTVYQWSEGYSVYKDVSK